MRKLKPLLLLLVIAIALFQVACNNNEKTAGATTRIMDVPVTSKSKEAIAFFQNGLSLLDDRNNQKAREMFTKAIHDDPNLAVAYLYRANVALSSKEYVDELEKAKAHLEGTSEWEKMYYDYQYTYVTNDWNKRLDVCKKMVAAYPEAARGYVNLGYTYQEGNQVNEERTAFQKATELDAKWIGGHLALASSYLFSTPKDFKKAEASALKLVEIAPTSTSAQILLGDTYRAQDNLEKANTAYTKAVSLNPDLPESYYKKGHVNSFLGKLEDARKDYMEGGKRDDNNVGYTLWVGNTYLYADDPVRARDFFMDNTVKLDGSNASKSKIAGFKMSYLNSCATTCFHTGDAPYLRKVITMMQAPSEQLAADIGTMEEGLLQKANLSYWSGLADAMEGKMADARTKAEEIKKSLEPVNVPTKLEDYHMLMGYIHLKEKKYSEAVSHFELTSPNSIYTKYWLAMAHEGAGNKDKATGLFKQIAVYNFNGTDYALIRNEVKNKLTL